MFYVLSKVLWIVAVPTNLLLLLLATGILLGWTRWRRTARWMATAATVLLCIEAFTPLGPAMLSPLEERFPKAAADIAAPTGIVVLGGAVDEDLTQQRDQVVLTESAARMTEGVALARRFPQARLVFSGGSGHLGEVKTTESDVARRLWLELGVPEARMAFESRSRNTHENALFTKELVKPKPGETWLLVTSAYHMPRSMGIFRQAGFPVIPYPVDYRTAPGSAARKAEFFASWNMRTVDTAAREWAGLAAYWLTGRTDALFPGP